MGQCQFPKLDQESQIEQSTSFSQDITSLKIYKTRIYSINRLSKAINQQSIEIDICQVSREEIKLIGNTLNNCKNLNCLDIKLRQMDEELVKKITEQLKQIENITSLSLFFDGWNQERNNQNIAKHIANLLNAQKKITKLSLTLGCRFSFDSDALKYIANSLKMLKNLISLSLQLELEYDQISFKAAKSLGDSLGQLKELTDLNLEFEINSRIIHEGDKYIVNKINNCSKITRLRVKLNSNCQGLEEIANCLENLKNLKELTLVLQGYIDSEQRIKSFSNALANNQKITKLSLECLGIQDQCIQLIACAIQSNIQITHLNLELGFRNTCPYDYFQATHFQLNIQKIGTLGSMYLSQSLEKLQDLTNLTLIMGHSNIGQNGVKNISDCLQKCLKLTNLNLDLSNCKINEEGLQFILKSLEESKNIITLDLCLNWNHFGQNQAQNISDCLQNCLKLSNLILHLRGATDQIGITLILQALVKSNKVITLYLDTSYIEWIQLQRLFYQSIHKLKRLVIYGHFLSSYPF
ncbi:hypothetical protein ABPG72_012154 [Tetrahymena utriculariae]